MLEIHLRVAEPSEADAVAALINAAFRVERFFIDGDRITAEQVRRQFHSGRFLVLEEAGRLVGCVYVEPRGERAYLGLLSIAPELQGGGLGSRLITAAEEHARAAGCRHMDLQTVNVRTELPPFYRRRGYAESGAAPFPPEAKPKIPCHFVKMTKAL